MSINRARCLSITQCFLTWLGVPLSLPFQFINLSNLLAADTHSLRQVSMGTGGPLIHIVMALQWSLLSVRACVWVWEREGEREHTHPEVWRNKCKKPDGHWCCQITEGWCRGWLWLPYSIKHMGRHGAAREGEPAFMPVTCSLFSFFFYPSAGLKHLDILGSRSRRRLPCLSVGVMSERRCWETHSLNETQQAQYRALQNGIRR